MLRKVDTRKDYGEERWVALGKLHQLITVMVYTHRQSKIRIPYAEQTVMNAKSMKDTVKSKTDWKKLSHATDAEIDYSDSSATTEDFWKDAQLFIPAHKTHISLRLDDDIVAFFKKQGRGYQTKINAALKSYVRAHSDATPPKESLDRSKNP